MSGGSLANTLAGDRRAVRTTILNIKWVFEVVSGNFNATGNKANGATVAGAMNSAFPTVGLGTP